MPYTRTLLVLLSLALGCTPKVPWPGKYTTEVLWYCTEDEGAWTMHDEEPPLCPTDRLSRGAWDLDSLPLTVNAERPLEDVTKAAVLAMNATLGFEMMVFETSNPDPDIVVLPKPPLPHKPRTIAVAIRGTIEGRDRGLIVVFHPTSASVIMHELGHILSLRHDDENESSLMHPSDIALVMEEADVALLRQLYAP